MLANRISGTLAAGCGQRLFTGRAARSHTGRRSVAGTLFVDPDCCRAGHAAGHLRLRCRGGRMISGCATRRSRVAGWNPTAMPSHTWSARETVRRFAQRGPNWSAAFEAFWAAICRSPKASQDPARSSSVRPAHRRSWPDSISIFSQPGRKAMSFGVSALTGIRQSSSLPTRTWAFSTAPFISSGSCRQAGRSSQSISQRRRACGFAC